MKTYKKPLQTFVNKRLSVQIVSMTKLKQHLWQEALVIDLILPVTKNCQTMRRRQIWVDSGQIFQLSFC